MTTRTWSSASETSIIETVCNVCICPCPDIHLPIVRHQKYERMPEDGMVVRVTVSMIRDLLHLSIVAALPSLVTHNGWSHRHTSHRVTRHTWHRTLGLRSRADQWPHTVPRPDLCSCRCDTRTWEHHCHDPFALFSHHILPDFLNIPHRHMHCTWCDAYVSQKFEIAILLKCHKSRISK